MLTLIFLGSCEHGEGMGLKSQPKTIDRNTRRGVPSKKTAKSHAAKEAGEV